MRVKKAESLEHRGALAPSYDGISTEFGTRPVEMATLLGAESLLRGLEKNNLSRRKKGDPRRALVTRINVSHVLSAGLGGGVYPKARLVGIQVFRGGPGGASRQYTSHSKYACSQDATGCGPRDGHPPRPNYSYSR